MKNLFVKIALSCATLLLAASGTANAGLVSVYVGYADGVRGGGFFPSIWDGSPNTVFDGVTTGSYDAGAIRIDNNGSSAITFNSAAISMPWAGLLNYSPGWSSHVLNPGEHLVLTETAHYNFDTSDYGVTLSGPVGYADGETAHATHIDITINGVALGTLLDTGHILTTGGFDQATFGNESYNWRLVGTTGITDPNGNGGQTVPEPSSIVMWGLGALGMAFARRKRRQMTIAS